MMIYLLQVTVCMAVFFAFYFIALRKETLFHSNRFYLLVTLCISFLLPLIRIYINALNTQSLIVQAPVFLGNYLQNFDNGITINPKDSNFNWINLLTIIYWSGVGVMVIRLLLSLRSIWLIKRKATIVKIENQFCVLSAQVVSPFSFFNTIFLPLQHAFTAEELKDVICHEHAHVKGKHSWDIFFLELTGIFLWPSPMIYFYRKALKEIHEFIADAAVIQHTSWTTYSDFLIQQRNQVFQNGLSSPLVYSTLKKRVTMMSRQYSTQGRLTNQLIYSQLKNRLMMMAQKPSSMLAKWKYSGVIPLFLLAMLIFSFRQKENNVASISNTPMEAQVLTGIDDNTEPPLFPGCEKVNEMEKADCSHKKMYEYVAQHLQYPEEMKKNKVEGKVYVKFVITNNGLVAQASIQKSLHPAADQAALDVVNGMNDNVGKWTPGTKEGRPVTMDMVLPISFVLNTKPESNPNSNSNSSTDVGSTSNPNAEVFSYVEEMPRFPGCENEVASSKERCAAGKMNLYIAENISYPKEDREKGKEGTVFAKFVVQADGSIANASIQRGVSPTMDAEVLRMINGMNTMPQRWIPGKNQGKPVAVEFTIPVKFKLGSNKQESKE